MRFEALALILAVSAPLATGLNYDPKAIKLSPGFAKNRPHAAKAFRNSAILWPKNAAVSRNVMPRTDAAPADGIPSPGGVTMPKNAALPGGVTPGGGSTPPSNLATPGGPAMPNNFALPGGLDMLKNFAPPGGAMPPAGGASPGIPAMPNNFALPGGLTMPKNFAPPGGAMPPLAPPGGSAMPKMAGREVEPPSNRNDTIPETLYVVQCLRGGFRKPCLTFGSPPGRCVNFSDYDTKANISGLYNNAVSALSTSTGGVCQWYKYPGCNNKGDDPGVTLDYAYDLAIAEDGYSGNYNNMISSWRC